MGEVKNFPFFLDNTSVMKRYISNLTHTLAKGGLIALFGAALICCKSGNCNKPQNNKITPQQDSAIIDGLKKVMAKNNAAGLAVVAVKDGEILYNKSLGYKDIYNQTPITQNDVMRIASISKSFTAIGILQLVEQGKLSLDSDVSEIMGFMIRNPKYPETPITVRMLLSHISSMSDSNGYFTFNNLHRDSSATWEKAWNDYAPGSRYQYCNLGYNTLGAILEKVSGERFDKYIENHIIKPLNLYASHNVAALDSTRFIKLYKFQNETGNTSMNDNTSNEIDYSCFQESTTAYQSQEQHSNNYIMGYSTPLFSPTGGLKISALDLAKVMMMHMNYGSLNIVNSRGETQNIKILDSTSCAMMQSLITPTNYNNEYYGMAIITTDNLLKGHTLTGHDGLALGAYTAMYWNKEENYGFVVFTNGCNGETEYDFANILCESVETLYNNIFKISNNNQN